MYETTIQPFARGELRDAVGHSQTTERHSDTVSQDVLSVNRFVSGFNHAWFEDPTKRELVCSNCGKPMRGTIGGCMALATRHRRQAPERVRKILDAAARFDTRFKLGLNK